MRRTPLLPILCALASIAAWPERARADWPPTGYPLCNVAEDLHVPIGLSEQICFGPAGPCGGQLTFYWQDGRSSFGSIYRATVTDALPPDPPALSEAELFVQRPGLQIPGDIVTVAYIVCLSQVCPQPFVFTWTDRPDTGGSIARARREQEPGMDWTSDGVIVASGEGEQQDPSAVHDLHGGVIVTWLEASGDRRRAFAQRLDAAGSRLWGDTGVLVGEDTTVQTRPRIAPDGAGGAYVLREDRRGGAPMLALFRLAPDGTTSPGWPADGVVVGTLPQTSPEPILRSSPFGAWLVWSEVVTLSDASTASRPFLTLIQSDGAVASGFSAAGAPVAQGLEGDALADDAVVGDAGDLVVALEYAQRLPVPSPTGTDLLATRTMPDGSHPAGWPAGGVLLCGAPGVQRQARVIAEALQSAGSFFFAWTDERSGDGDIYAMRLLGDGTAPTEWPAQGLAVCDVAGTQQDPVIGWNAVGGGFVGWRDGRDGLTNGWDLYAQTVSSDARLDVERPVARALALSPPRPNPSRGSVRFRIELPEARRARFEVLDVAGRLVHREELPGSAGPREVSWDLRTDHGARARPGLYLARVVAGSFVRSTRVVVTE